MPSILAATCTINHKIISREILPIGRAVVVEIMKKIIQIKTGSGWNTSGTYLGI